MKLFTRWETNFLKVIEVSQDPVRDMCNLEFPGVRCIWIGSWVIHLWTMEFERRGFGAGHLRGVLCAVATVVYIAVFLRGLGKEVRKRGFCGLFTAVELFADDGCFGGCLIERGMWDLYIEIGGRFKEMSYGRMEICGGRWEKERVGCLIFQTSV